MAMLQVKSFVSATGPLPIVTACPWKQAAQFMDRNLQAKSLLPTNEPYRVGNKMIEIYVGHCY
jgi:hypothetical protein